MDVHISTQLNISWNVIKAWLCNETIIQKYKFNVTCNGWDDHSNGTHGTPVHAFPHTVRIVIMAAIIFFVGVVSNIALLITSVTSKRFRKPSWKYITNLAVADVLVMIAMACFIFSIVASPGVWSESINGVLFPSVDILLASASMLSVAAIALDRVYTVRSLEKRASSPFAEYPNAVIVSIWSYSFVIFFLALCRSVVDSDVFHKFVFWTMTSVTYGVVMVTVICYAIITFYYVKYTAVSNRMLHSLQDESVPMSQVREHKVQLAQVRKAFLAVMTPLPFVFGWLFFLGTQTYEYVNDIFITDINWNIAMIIVPWVVSALNPIIYMLMSKSIRKQVKSSCKKLFIYSTEQVKSPHCEETIQLTYE